MATSLISDYVALRHQLVQNKKFANSKYITSHPEFFNGMVDVDDIFSIVEFIESFSMFFIAVIEHAIQSADLAPHTIINYLPETFYDSEINSLIFLIPDHMFGYILPFLNSQGSLCEVTPRKESNYGIKNIIACINYGLNIKPIVMTNIEYLFSHANIEEFRLINDTYPILISYMIIDYISKYNRQDILDFYYLKDITATIDSCRTWYYQIMIFNKKPHKSNLETTIMALIQDIEQ